MDHRNDNNGSPIIVKIPFSSFSLPLLLRKSTRLRGKKNASLTLLSSSVSSSNLSTSNEKNVDGDSQLKSEVIPKKKKKTKKKMEQNVVAVTTPLQNRKERKKVTSSTNTNDNATKRICSSRKMRSSVRKKKSPSSNKAESKPNSDSELNIEENHQAVNRKEPMSRNAKRTFSSSKKVSKSSPSRIKISSSDLLNIKPNNKWIDLNVTADELRPSATLTTGQCFNWIVVDRHDDKKDSSHREKFSVATKSTAVSAWGTHNETEWIGPLGKRVISIRETPTTTLYRVLYGSSKGVDDCLRNYFQLETPLSPLYEEWSQSDTKRLAKIAKAIPGVRILRQDPVECLFSFLCSSNNNIPRITKMLASIRNKYGIKMIDIPTTSASIDEGSENTKDVMTIYSFPTLKELQSSKEEDLRELGLGYRAKYIVQTIDKLIDLGGEDFLLSLRKIDDPDIVQNELLQFCGVGRKVADCVALFSLDQYNAVPVDVHVMNIASRDYDTSLSDGTIKSLTPTVYKRIGDLFRNKFPSYAGWAHSLLFVAELPSFRDVLPKDILKEMDEWKREEMEKKAIEKAAKKKRKIREGN